MEENKVPSAVVNSKIYNKMMNSACKLHECIRQKHSNGETVTQEESDFANDFSAYAKELVDVLKGQGF